MKFYNFQSSHSLGAVFGWFCTTLLLALSANTVYAQQNQAERWLFAFDTSSQMKKDLPATIVAVEQMLSSSADGQLHAGDSVGIWTYDQRLHAGQVPLFDWKPDRASIISSNLVAYLKHQHYRDDSDLGAVQSFLPQVVAHSKRLTTVIFCDGNSLLTGTPYDDGVNQSFHNSLAERKKSRQPFVLVLRSQLGKYVNCTVAYPPGSINLPPFPKLPPPPTNNATVAKAQAKAPSVPPLVIIGTKVGTNLNATAEVAEPETNTHNKATKVVAQAAGQPEVRPATIAPTNSPSVLPVPSSESAAAATNLETTAKVVKTAKIAPVSPATNAVGVPATNIAMAGSLATSSSPTNVSKSAAAGDVTTQTIAAAMSQATPPHQMSAANGDESDRQSRILIWLGVGLIAAAAVLLGLLIFRPGRRSRGSLISSSMQDDIRRK